MTEPARGSRARRLGARLALAIGGLAVALIAAEIGLRVAALARREATIDDLEAMQRGRGEVASEVHGPLALGDRIRRSALPGIVYEWKPGVLWIDADGVRHTINEAGFRGRPVPRAKAPGTIRIVGLGDSVAYGNGVSDDDVFLVRLEEALNRSYPAARWETVNTAVAGYNTAIEVATLREKGLAYHPDLVILYFVRNDVELPGFLAEPVRPLDLSRSFLLDLVATSLGGRDGRLHRVRKPSRAERGGGRADAGPADVPPELRDVVGEEGVRRALRELVELRRRHGFELLVVTGVEDRIIMDTSAELGLPLLSMRATRHRFRAENGGREASRGLLKVSASDPHPSALGHRLIASAIAERLESDGMIARLLARAGAPGGSGAGGRATGEANGAAGAAAAPATAPGGAAGAAKPPS